MKTVNIADIRINGGTQSRAAINKEVVADYADAMDGGAEFPPLVVFFDGSSYWLADGFHRYEAFARSGAHDVPADIRQGSQRDAVLYSVGANAAHGLRRTNDDKRRAVMVLLNDPEWSKWSNREIARQCGVSERLVRDVRPICDKNADSAPRTVTRNGTTYEQNTANIGSGSKPAQEVTTPAPQENKAETAEPVEKVTTPSKPDQEPDPHRKGLSGLSRDGLEDEVAGLRAENEELRAKLKQVQAERDRFKAANKELTESSDQGRTIGKLQRQIASITYARDEAMKAVKREEYKHNLTKKELAKIMGEEIHVA